MIAQTLPAQSRIFCSDMKLNINLVYVGGPEGNMGQLYPTGGSAAPGYLGRPA